MRKAKVERKTKETEIVLEVAIDGTGKSSLNSSIPFLDHMLELLAKHGLFDITLRSDLTNEERERLSQFPEQIEEEDIIAFFTVYIAYAIEQLKADPLTTITWTAELYKLQGYITNGSDRYRPSPEISAFPGGMCFSKTITSCNT